MTRGLSWLVKSNKERRYFVKIFEDKNGKFMLIDVKKKEMIGFDYAVDAEEALRTKDEDGNQRYSLPVVPKKGIISKKKEDEEDQIEELSEGEIEVIEAGKVDEPVAKREVKVLAKGKGKGKGKK